MVKNDGDTVSWKDFALRVLQIIRPRLRNRVILTLLLAGIALLSQPLWEVLLVALLNYSVPAQIAEYNWFGWILIVIALAIFTVIELPATIADFRNIRPIYAKDVELFERMNSMFFENGTVDYLRTHDFLNDARKDVTDRVIEFYDMWNDANHAFIDSELEQLRLRARASAEVLAHAIAKNTVPTTGGRFVTVRGLDHRELTEWMRRDAMEINGACPAFVADLERLAIKGREKLYR